MDTNLKKFIISVPKVELHLHAEGCISVDTLWRLFQKNQPPIEGIHNKEDVQKHYDNINSLERFIHFFIHTLQKCVCDIEDLHAYNSSILEYLRENNIRHAEVFFSPSKLLMEGFRYKDIASVLQEGAKQIANDARTCHFLIDVSRSFGVENAMNNLNHLLSCPQDAIIGIGLGGSEQSGPAKQFVEVFSKARLHGLRCVAHAGEDIGPESIWDAINFLQVERIGHGLSAILDPHLREKIKQLQIPLETCITSNVFTNKFISKASEHPVRTFFDEGLPITLNSDDPMIFASGLNDEYLILAEECQFQGHEILQIMENNIQYSFMEDAVKRSFILEIRRLAKQFAII